MSFVHIANSGSVCVRLQSCSVSNRDGLTGSCIQVILARSCFKINRNFKLLLSRGICQRVINIRSKGYILTVCILPLMVTLLMLCLS